MPADYSKYKTPFFEIEIGDSSGQKLVKLPHHILRLVEKIEIMETFITTEFSTITIDFIEGSREPSSPNAMGGTSGLYQIPDSSGNNDKAISGSITNRVGSLVDLRFSGDNGITWLTAEERKQGKVDNTPQETVFGQVRTRKHKKENSKPTFLFQERNQVKVTWGYLEDYEKRRSVRGYITVLNTQYPESGHVKTTITCQPTRTFLDQVATVKGKPFGTRIRTDKGNSIVIWKDLPTDELIRKIANDAGMAHIVSKNLLGSTVDSDKQKTWLGGESFDQFMVRLADLHNCYYSVSPDRETGKDTIYFIKKQDYENKLIISDTSLTRYKTPGSILKSVSIQADFGTPSGNTQVGVNKEGKEEGRGTDASIQEQLFKDKNGKIETLSPNNPTGNGNPISAVDGLEKNVANGGLTGTVDNNPSNSVERKDAIADSKTFNSNRNIILEFTSLGYVGFFPGVILFDNLGVRYSGKYRLQKVSHIIDSSGYLCKGTAISATLPQGGVAIPEAPKAKESAQQIEVRLVKSKTGESSRTKDEEKLASDVAKENLGVGK